MRVLFLLAGAVVAATLGSAFMVAMPGTSYRGPLPPLSAEEDGLRARLETHVQVLAGRIGERNVWRYTALRAAAEYIRTAFAASGYAVAAQEFAVSGHVVSNLEVVLPGTRRAAPALIIGAHYDSVRGSPGANDNASGVAALLEIARLLAGQRFARSIHLVAFVNEEAPFYQSENMGSVVYARRFAARKEHIMGMFSLETLGYYSDRKHSQRYPFPFGLFYPGTGNFVAFVGNVRSRGLVRRALASFREHAAFPSEGTAAPGWLPGVGWSDHHSFWQQGYPAVMITDTALFRYAQYHTAADRPAVVDYPRLARVVAGLARMVADLASTASLESPSGGGAG